MKRFHISAAVIAGIGLAGLCSESFAQSTSLFGSSGPISRTSTTSRSTGSTFGTTSGAGTTGGFGTTGGLGTTGRTGQTGQTGGFGTQQTGSTSGQAGGTGSGFVGRNDNAGRFVGQQNAGTQTSRNTRTFQGVQRTGGDPNTVNRNAANAARNTGGGTGTQQTVRPVLRVAFNYPQRAATTIRTRVSTRFQNLAVRQPRFRGITFDVNGDGEVILRGTVQSEDVKSLAANLARLEPGVREVKNQLIVRK